MANFFQENKNKKPSKSLLTLNVTRLDDNGCGVGRLQNKPVFIQGALPSEMVEVKIIEQKNKFIRAKLLKIKTPNINRVEPKCLHFGSCGGCDLQMLAFEKQLPFKQQKVSSLFSRYLPNQVLPWQEPITSQPWHYRRKARLGVQFNKNSEATIGFRQRSTNQLTAIKSCPVLVEPLNNIFIHLKSILVKLTVKAAIGHIEVIHADIANSTDNVVLVIRQLKPLNSHDVILWKEYALKYHCQVIIDEGKNQYILSEIDSVSTLRAEGKLNDLSYTLPHPKKATQNEVEDISIHFSSNDFIQINHVVNKEMIEQAISWLEIKPSDNVLDLFCGLGNFSLALATLANQVIGVEGVQAMVDKAKLNAKKNAITNCTFYQADLNADWLKLMWAKQAFTKVLLDPARSGAEQAVQQIAKLKIPTVLYVSCDPATLARDSEILVLQGYQLEKISLIDMFSQTKHIETMVLFTRT